MTTDIKFGSAAPFVVEFLDANGNPGSADSAVLDITYPVGLTATSTSITMTKNNSFFTATWQSAVSDLGLVTWIATASNGRTVSGDLRIVGINGGPAPEISSISAGSGSTGQTITISGKHFTSVNSIFFDGVSANFTHVNDQTITTVVP